MDQRDADKRSQTIKYREENISDMFSDINNYDGQGI